MSVALLLDNVEETRAVAKIGFRSPTQRLGTNNKLLTRHTRKDCVLRLGSEWIVV